MSISPSAGQPVSAADVVNIPRLIAMYYTERPDPGDAGQHVKFGTSGHRGSPLKNSFNEDHILAISQAICEYRQSQGTSGPLFLGMDTHALSEPAFITAVEVLAGNGVEVMIDSGGGYTPTPAISHAILNHNRGGAKSDGIVITPSHNPPQDGGIKYNPPSGGPAGTEATGWIADRANELLGGGLAGVKRMPYGQALRVDTTHRFDYLAAYIDELPSVVNVEAIRGAGLKLAADALGGAGLAYWGAIDEKYKLGLKIFNADYDPTFRFMTLDWDGKIRMDCSSRYAMANLIGLKDEFDVACACDTDHDRHGIVTRSAGLLNPNHYLSVAVWYLFTHREGWPAGAGVGKTAVSSSMIDRVTAAIGRKLDEVPVGFKWFVDGLLDGSLGFGGEESAGASFLRMDGSAWSTDKDGILMGLLASEMMAGAGRDPGELYRRLTEEHGEPVYERIDRKANSKQKALLGALSAEQVHASELAGEKIERILTNAPGNNEPIGGLKVVTKNGWFAARPSGTEDVYKIYTESFLGAAHLHQIQEEAQGLVSKVFAEAGV